MPITYNKIATATVGSGGATFIEFTSIPQTYTDLSLQISVRGSGSGINGRLEINAAGTNNTTNRFLQGNGSAASSGSGTDISFLYPPSGATASTFGNVNIYFPNYSLTTINKSFSVDSVGENNGTLAYAWLNAGIYSANTAISSIKIKVDSVDNFVQHSTATLYGIKKD
jgi:hypothetical protein